MRVLHVNDYSAGGGAEVHMAAIADLLRQAGAQVQVFTSEDLSDARLNAWRYIDSSQGRKALRGTLEAFRPDIVHLHNFYHVLSPGVLAELAKARSGWPEMRIIMTAHDYHLVCPNSGGSWFGGGDSVARPIDPSRLHSWRYLLTRRWDHRGTGYSVLKLAQHVWNYRLRNRREVIDLVICPSRFIEAMMHAAGLRAMYLPHPVPTAGANRHSDVRSNSREHGLSSGSPRLRLVFAGRVEPEKGLTEFLQMLPGDFAGNFTVIGEGTEMERCRALGRSRGFGDRIQFLGRLPHEKTIAAIANCDVLILPSLCLENCPMSLIEALAVGTNILVSNLGGMKEIIESSGTGFLFNPGDAMSLQVALDQIAECHRNGTLNDFDVSDFLNERSEIHYVEGLLQAYGHEDIPAEFGVTVAAGSVK